MLVKLTEKGLDLIQALFPKHAAVAADTFAALESDEVELHYQPRIDYTTNRVVGAEALLNAVAPDKANDALIFYCTNAGCAASEAATGA